MKSKENDIKNYSVLMSVYKNDNSQFLFQAIESMLNQTLCPEQFVIVEDGPVNDDIESVISRYENENRDLFTVVRLKNNGGLGNALNQGLKVCRNELIARMDADDISFPERCELQVNCFKSNCNLCILGAQIYEFVGSTDNIVSSRRVPCSFKDITVFAKRRSPFNHPTVMYKKSVIQELGGYPTLNRKEDLGLFIKAVNENCYSENLDKVLLYYRTSEENQKRRKTWVNCKEYIQVMWGFYRKKYCGTKDILYVIIGQLSMFILPTSLSQRLSKKYLRK